MTNGNDQDLSEESSDDPVKRLWAAVIHEWEAHGRPEYSEIEKWTIDTKQRHRLSRGTLSDWFANHRMPREGWDKFEVLLLYFNVNTRQWRRDLWLPAERFARERRRRTAQQPPRPRTESTLEPAATVPDPAAAGQPGQTSPHGQHRADRISLPRSITSATTRVVPLLAATALVLSASSDLPRTAKGTGPTGTTRLCAKVTALSAPVFPRPDDRTKPLKYKYRNDNVVLVAGLHPITHAATTYRAVRTPRDANGISWMRTTDLSIPRRCSTS